MRKFALLLFLAVVILPALAAKRVTVKQLEQMLAANHGKPDVKIAQQISGLELTERLSAARLLRLESDLPGPETRRSLLVLADMSAFLDLPAEQTPTATPPNLAAQRQLMALTVDYVSKTIHHLPNFFAIRDTNRFEDTPEEHRADASLIPYQPLHPVGTLSDTVLYRDGQEVVESRAAKGKYEQAAQGLTTSGVFGPILATVLVDAAHGELVWSHWEQGVGGPQAVFRYAVPRQQSHYQVKVCCVRADNGIRVFQQLSAYHGLIAVDPVNGAILRLTLQADLKPTDPIIRSDIVAEYGPVEIGGKTYICPVRSVSIVRAPVVRSNASEMQLHQGILLETVNQTAPEHMQTLLNDVVFDRYHVFRSDARLMTADNAELNRETSAPPSAGTNPAETRAPQSKRRRGLLWRMTDRVDPERAAHRLLQQLPRRVWGRPSYQRQRQHLRMCFLRSQWGAQPRCQILP